MSLSGLCRANATWSYTGPPQCLHYSLKIQAALKLIGSEDSFQTNIYIDKVLEGPRQIRLASHQSTNMLPSATFTKLATFITLFALVQDEALGAPGSLIHNPRHALHKRNREAGCGSLKSMLPNVGSLAGQCVCFSGGTAIFGQTPQALQYSIDLPVRYPAQVSQRPGLETVDTS